MDGQKSSDALAAPERAKRVQRLVPVPAEKCRATVPYLVLNFFKKRAGEAVDFLGRLTVGALPDEEGVPTYDSWSWCEAGGAVTIPFAFIDGMVYVGVVTEFRSLEVHPVFCPDGYVMNAPRGFLDEGKTLLECAKEELRQEMGDADARVFALPGDPTNCNNAFVQYYDRPDGSRGGISFFAAEINPGLLERVPGSDALRRFRDGAVVPPAKGSLGEKVLKATFMPWADAVRIRDMMTVAAIARLMAYLASRRTG